MTDSVKEGHALRLFSVKKEYIVARDHHLDSSGVRDTNRTVRRISSANSIRAVFILPSHVHPRL